MFFGVLVNTGGMEVELTGLPCAPSSAQSYFCWVTHPYPWLNDQLCIDASAYIS